MRRVQQLSRHVFPDPVAAPVDLPSEAVGLARRDRTRRDTISRPKSQFSPAEWEARCKLAVAYRLAAHYGWDELVFNHITLKVPESDRLSDGPHFLINPFGLRFDEVTAPQHDNSTINPLEALGGLCPMGPRLQGMRK